MLARLPAPYTSLGPLHDTPGGPVGLARHQQSGCLVLVQELAPWPSQEELLRVSHPCLPQILEVYPGRRSFVAILEKVEGPVLTDYLAAARHQSSLQELSHSQILCWGLQLADWLQRLYGGACALGVDWSPQHLRVAPDGSLRFAYLPFLNSPSPPGADTQRLFALIGQCLPRHTLPPLPGRSPQHLTTTLLSLLQRTPRPPTPSSATRPSGFRSKSPDRPRRVQAAWTYR